MFDMEDVNKKLTCYLNETLEAGIPIYYLNNEGDLVIETSRGSIKKLKSFENKSYTTKLPLSETNRFSNAPFGENGQKTPTKI